MLFLFMHAFPEVEHTEDWGFEPPFAPCLLFNYRTSILIPLVIKSREVGIKIGER